MSDPRTRARGLSTDALARGDAVGWFDRLYREAVTGGAIVPWADLRPNPHLVDWLGQGARSWSHALVVGCEFGDDAEYLADHGAGRVTAFDVSSTAIAEARRRFPESRVDYLVADAFDPPAAWRGSFDLIVEIYTLQVLPPELREQLVRRLVDWVAPGGTLCWSSVVGAMRVTRWASCRGHSPGRRWSCPSCSACPAGGSMT